MLTPSSTTGPAVAASGINERRTNGTAYISTQYTKTKYFSISSMYMGLLVSTGQGVATIAIQGTVKVTGYQAGSHAVVGPVILQLAPSICGRTPLQKVTLPSTFKKLTKLTLEPDSAFGKNLTAVNIDDVSGTTTS